MLIIQIILYFLSLGREVAKIIPVEFLISSEGKPFVTHASANMVAISRVRISNDDLPKIAQSNAQFLLNVKGIGSNIVTVV